MPMMLQSGDGVLQLRVTGAQIISTLTQVGMAAGNAQTLSTAAQFLRQEC